MIRFDISNQCDELMSIRCILIDDEIKAITSLSYDLEQYGERITVLSTFTKARDAIAFLNSHSVDVVFLDVEMPNMNGFDFLEQLPDKQFEVVFTTAYNQYAIAAIRKEALDYLVKPIDPIELEKTIDRIEQVLQRRGDTQKSGQSKDIENDQAENSRKIKLAYDKKIVFKDPDEIIYCESEGNYCRIILEGDKEIFYTHKLKHVETIVPSKLFFRVHNSFLVNLTKVKEYHKHEGYLILTDDSRIPVSRRKKNEVLERL